ncbi:hypothetical protein LA080_014654 [Diaporthe eres]|nr:hypothetical protein LA080_014654 [Diaporthe eres]
MTSSSSAIDWDQLKPRILQDLANGKTQRQIRQELAEDPFSVSISKSQLETRLKNWKYRNSLHEQEWKVVSHRINKRRKAGKTTSQVLVNGFIFNERKVVKAVSRYDRPTLAYRLPSPQIPYELSHHVIEIRTPPPSRRSLQLPPFSVVVAPTTWESLAPLLTSAGRVWPRTAEWREVELSVAQFVARFFLPTYEQDERFRDAFKVFGRELPVSRTDRGQQMSTFLADHEKSLAAQAWATSTEPHDGIPVHRHEIQKSFGGLRIQTAVVEILVRLLYGLSNQSLGHTGHEALASIMDAPAWDTVLPPLRDALAIMDSKIIGADPTQRIRSYDDYGARDVLSVPLVAISEDVIRSQPRRIIDFAIAVSDLGGGIRNNLEDFGLVTPLVVACSDQRQSAEKLSIIRCLLERGAKADLQAMIAAVAAGDGEIICLLHQHGAPVNGFIPKLGSPISSACEAAVRFRGPDYSLTALPVLLRLGASPCNLDNMEINSQTLSPLQILAGARETPAVAQALESLLQHGANINRRIDVSPHTDPETALECAIANSNWKTAFRILSAGCQLTGREIIFAATSKYVWNPVGRNERGEQFRQFIGELLAKAPRQAAALHCSGLTVLQRAVQGEHEDMILALFAFGLKPQPTDFLYMFDDRGPRRVEHVCRLSSSIQMKLFQASRFSELPVTDMSTFRLILAVACPAVIRQILNGCADVYDSEGLCYMIARFASENNASYLISQFMATYFQYDEILTMEDLQFFVSRRTIDNRQDDWEKTAVTIAARAGRADILQTLIEPGQDDFQPSGLIPSFIIRNTLACEYNKQTTTGNWDRLGVWIKYCRMDDPNTKCSPLTAAAMVVPANTAEEIVDLLLELNYQPDGWTVLVASRLGHLSILLRLRQLKCWPNILRHNDRPDWCPTALQIAAYTNHVSMVRVLVDAGTLTDAIDVVPCRPFCYFDGLRVDYCSMVLPRTALQHAVEKENMELVTLLISAGADVNAPAAVNSGATALQIASIQGSVPMIEYLVSQGADPYASGAARHGRTALQGAAEHGRKDAVELLLALNESKAYQPREQFVKAIFYAEKNAQHVVAGILRERLLPRWTSEDEEMLEMFSEDWESSSENSVANEFEREIRDWEETFEDWSESSQEHETTSNSDVTIKQPFIENPLAFQETDVTIEQPIFENELAFQENDSWFLQELEFGIAGHEGLDSGQISEIDLYNGDVVSGLALQEDTAAWVEGQPSLEGDGVDNMMLDDLSFNSFS